MAKGSGMVRLYGLAALAVLSWAATTARADTITVDGKTVEVTPEQKAQFEAFQAQGGVVGRGARGPRGMRPARPGGDMPQPAPGDQPPKQEGEPKKSDGPKPAEDGAATVKRSDDNSPPDPKELKAKPDEDGKVEFSFRNQPWADVLQWYAEISKSSLDWQELPADKLNLVTQRRYTVVETRDLLNRYLLARGFTMLAQGDVLTVAKVDKIDPSLVQRVEPDDLEDHQPYDFARVRFDLPAAMDPAKAVEDVKVLLTPTAKVTPLLASKQIMVIDPVANLRDVRDLLYGQRMVESSDIRPELFQIRHRRADYIASQVMIVLGLDPSSRKEPMELQVEQQRIQLMMQMQQQGKDVSGMLKKDGPQVFLAVDKRRNTLSVNAPPKEMEIVKRVVKQFDVPGVDVDVETADDSLTTKRYQTVAVSPDAIVTALKEIANLSPLTQMQTDAQSKTIFATATAADHETIKGMIAKLDGSGRELHVIWLSRRTPADQIAGTIQALMVGEKKEENNNRNRYYGYYDPFGSRSNQDDSQKSGFRIQADVEHNRLIVMANESEFAEVNKMLGELGVVTNSHRGNPSAVRILEARDPAETAELLKRLQESWDGRNPLNINVAPPAEEPAKKPADEKPAVKPAANREDTVTSAAPSVAARRPVWLAQFAEESAPATAEAPSADAPAVESPELAPATAGSSTAAPAADSSAPSTTAASPTTTAAAKPAPVNVTVTPDGRIVISSDDPAAMDQLQDMLEELAPPRRQFKNYELTNARALDVWWNLKDYFADELAGDDNDLSFFFGGGNDNKETTSLGKARKLRFIYDPPTNSVLVQNASEAQLQTIDQLVKIYDQAAPEDAVRKRRTEIVQVKYSRANDIATALKDVFRDLLSSKDKEFQNREGNGERGGGGPRPIFYSFSGGGSSSTKSAPVKMSFEGALSVGVDTVSNTLIISAEEQIFNTVKEIVTQLDDKAMPDTIVQVHQLSGSLDAVQLQKALSTAISRPWQGNMPVTPAGGGGGGDGNRGDGGGGGRGGGFRGDRGGDRGDRGGDGGGGGGGRRRRGGGGGDD